MVKPTASTPSTREPIKTRKASQSERRSSVSEITEYFQSNMAPDKTSKSKNQNKGKKDDREKEMKDSPASSPQMQNQENKENDIIEAVTPPSNKDCDNHDKHSQSVDAENNTKNNDKVASQDATTQTSEDESLKLYKVLKQQVDKLEDAINKPKLGLNDQLAKNISTTQDLYSTIHGKVDGILVKVQKISDSLADTTSKMALLEASQQRISTMLDESKRLASEIKILQGLVQKISQQGHHASSQLLNLTKRGMEQNLIIHGIDNLIEIMDPKEDPPRFTSKERCKHSALEFFKTIMNLDLSMEDIWKAHRIGAFKTGKVRPMVVKLAYPAKDLVMENISALKGKKNTKTDQVYFISEQIPDGITEVKKQATARAKSLKEANEKKPVESRARIQIIQDKVIVDGELDTPVIQPPQPSDLFLCAEDQARVDALQAHIVETEPTTVKNSEFRALALKVKSVQQMKDAYIAVAQRYPSADHIMAAFAFKDKGNVHHGACDDKEFGAAAKIKNVIFQTQAKDTAVFVVRKYGGIHLGIERFKTISTVAQNALDILQT